MPTRPKTFRPAGTSARKAAPRRETRQQRGYTDSWLEYAAWYRSQPENVLCACGCRRPSEHVDHIIPAEPGSDEWWDMEGHQALARACHTRKTIRFDGAYGKSPDVSPAGRQSLDAMLDAARVRAASIRAREAVEGYL
jgi:5-methylcytosine-specific restriction protein A